MFKLLKNLLKPRNLVDLLEIELKDAELDLYKIQEEYHWEEVRLDYYTNKILRVSNALKHAEATLKTELEKELNKALHNHYKTQESYYWNEAKVKYYEGKCERLALRLLPVSESD